jgi:hypothetical protein
MEKKMNKKWLPHIIAVGTLAVFVVLGLASGTTDAATKKIAFNNAEESKEYLASQEENKPDNPIGIAVPADDSTLKDVLDTIKSVGRYVSLELSGNALTTIPPYAFKDNTFIISITLPDSVTSIKDNAFSDCPNLTDINFGSKVASISYTAFNNCPKLLIINADYRNQNYTSGSYNQENGVSSRPLYNKNKTILIRCPEGYKGYEGKFIIADSVRAVAPYCFYQTLITNIPFIYEDIGSYAFYGSSITKIIFKGGGLNLSAGKLEVQKIHEGAFVNCTSLTSVTFDGITELEKGSFDGDLFELWDKATTNNFNDGSTGRSVDFKGTFTRPNGTSAKWTRR